MFHRMMNYGEIEAKPTVVLIKDVISRILPKYKRHDDLIIVQEQLWKEFKESSPIPVTENENSPFSIDEDELASLVCQTVQKPICRRLAIEKQVKNDDYRSPNVKLILGQNGLVIHRYNHILYQFDVTKCMFSFGNAHEKLRMASLDCSDEVVVDLFAGIGYFTLPLLVHSKAKYLYACEWNPDSIDSLRKNLILNKITPDRYSVIEGDSRTKRPTNVAQRILLGILPSCLEYMKTAFQCVDKRTGAILHCHDLVNTKIEEENHINEFEERITRTGLDCRTTNNAIPSPKTKHMEVQSLPNQSYTFCSSKIEKLSLLNDGLEQRLSESDKVSSSISPLVGNLDGNSSDSNSNVVENGNNCCRFDVNDPNHELGTENNLPQVRPMSDQASHSNKNGVRTNSIDDAKPLEITNSKMDAFEARAQALIKRITDELDEHELTAKLIKVQPVKSYAPHVIHVVFDIKVEPISRNRK